MARYHGASVSLHDRERETYFASLQKADHHTFYMLSLLVFSYANSTGPLDQEINAFARSARRNFTAASGFVQPQICASYGHGDEDRATLYSAANLPRLRSLKAKWDPGNAYRFTHPLMA